MTGSFIASIAIKATIILALGLAALRFLRQSPAAVRHLLLLAVCATVLALPIATLVLPVLEVPLPYHVSVPVPAVVRDAHADVAFTPLAGVPVTRVSSEPVSFIEWMLVLEGLGTGLALLPVIAGLWQSRRLRAVARPWSRGQTRIEQLVSDAQLRRQVQVLIHDGLPGPVTCGVWRPVLLFPSDAEDWDDKDFEGAAIHELEHVRRNDWATDCFARVVCALYWFHPLAWMTWQQLRLESERAADDAVVRAREGTAYAELLVTLAERLLAGQRNYVVAMASRRHLPLRIQALLDGSLPRARAGRRSVVIAVLLAASAVLTVAPLGALREEGRTHVEAFAPSPIPLLQIQDSPRQSFEVASVKPNKSSETAGFIRGGPGGNFAVTNQTLSRLILFAYGIQGFQLVGAPEWTATEHFDIVARAPVDFPPTPFGGTSPSALMLRSLLEDRFRLTVHRGTRDLPIYALVVARTDGRLGPRLRRPTSDYCAQQLKAAAKPGFTPPSDGGPICGLRGTDNGVEAGALPLSEFPRFLARQVGRTVVDRTGLTGAWDFDLKWSSPDVPNVDADFPSIFTALQEQLGLRLDATTGPVEVLIVDRVEPLIPD